MPDTDTVVTLASVTDLDCDSKSAKSDRQSLVTFKIPPAEKHRWISKYLNAR